jgi:Cdc6-like AAA superfamily ATPase
MIRIIEFRLGPHKGLFTKSAIEFAAKKIAIKSTDIRKLLKLFQVSLENFMKLKQKFVTIEHIKETYNRMFANPIVTTISNLNKVVKGILSDILTEIKETKECWFDNLI